MRAKESQGGPVRASESLLPGRDRESRGAPGRAEERRGEPGILQYQYVKTKESFKGFMFSMFLLSFPAVPTNCNSRT